MTNSSNYPPAPECPRKPGRFKHRSSTSRHGRLTFKTRFRRHGWEGHCPLKLPQCCAQAFFNNRVVEGAIEHLLHAALCLMGPGQQVSYMLGGRTYHFCSKKLA